MDVAMICPGLIPFAYRYAVGQIPTGSAQAHWRNSMRFSRRKTIGLSAAIPLLALGKAGAQTPVASPEGTDTIAPLDTGDVNVLSISPDGSTLVGIVDQNTIVFLNAETLEEISRSEVIDVIHSIDAASLRWSPDGSRIAFSLDAWLLGQDSDIFIGTVETGDVVNATAEGHEEEAGSLLGDSAEGPITIDVAPAWLDDSTVIFGRHPWGNFAGPRCELTTLNIVSGEIATWQSFPPYEIANVINNLHVLNDGRIIFTGNDTKALPFIVIASGDDTFEILTVNDVDHLLLIGVGVASVIVQDPQTLEFWRCALDGSVEPQDLREVFELETDDAFPFAPAYGPDGSSLLTLRASDNTLLVADDAGVRPVGTVSGIDSTARITWVEGRALIATRQQAWLVPIS